VRKDARDIIGRGFDGEGLVLAGILLRSGVAAAGPRKKIAVIPGDGIGKEVTARVCEVIRARVCRRDDN